MRCKKVRFWQILAIRFWRFVMASEDRCPQEQVRLWRLFLKIDFAQLIAIAIDITQPEFWI